MRLILHLNHKGLDTYTCGCTFGTYQPPTYRVVAWWLMVVIEERHKQPYKIRTRWKGKHKLSLPQPLPRAFTRQPPLLSNFLSNAPPSSSSSLGFPVIFLGLSLPRKSFPLAPSFHRRKVRKKIGFRVFVCC